GGGTKMAWGRPGDAAAAPLSTLGLNEVLEHNAGDLTAVVQAGVNLADAQKVFAGARQMLALDPPLGGQQAATIGGVVATGDGGPFRHHYGAVRDQVIGIRVALADGTVAQSGGRVIKNVAGYDLAKLFSGSFGTLGIILEVSFRLHPMPEGTVTLVGTGEEAEALAAASVALSNSPLRAACLDFNWDATHGSVLARFGGRAARDVAQQARQFMENAGLETRLEEDDHGLWETQRARQRSDGGVIAKVSALPAEVSRVIAAARQVGATAVGRAGLGVAWLDLGERRGMSEYTACLETLRASLAPRPVVLQDAPEEVRQALDVWGPQPGSLVTLMRRVKQRFDPSGVCNRGIFVAGI
ncbi:MAG: FAD-binding oxidoreductase, partial [Actinomycetota bacterium]